MAVLSDHYGLADLQYNAQNILSKLDSAGNMVSKGLIDTYNYFLGINIANSPQYMFTEGWTDHRFGLCFGAILIPLLAALTQWLNVKLMPQAGDNNNNSNAASGDTGAAMQQSMKTMNMMMPLMSAFFCFTLPSGMGIYWIAGAVIRTIQQIFINKHIDKMDVDAMIEKNKEKAQAKAEKRKEKNSRNASLSESAGTSTTRRTVANRDSRLVTKLTPAEEARIDEMNQSRKQKKYKKDSLSYHADMVRRFNEFGQDSSEE
jgi:YidC/Oxa1 family membrane protein insertase